MAKFELGRLVMTESVAARMIVDTNFDAFVKTSLSRYVQGDWGTLCEDDKDMSDKSVEEGDHMIMGTYAMNGTEIWIITEWDRSATTILFPHER